MGLSRAVVQRDGMGSLLIGISVAVAVRASSSILLVWSTDCMPEFYHEPGQPSSWL